MKDIDKTIWLIAIPVNFSSTHDAQNWCLVSQSDCELDNNEPLLMLNNMITLVFVLQYYTRARLLALHLLYPDKYEKPSLIDEVVSSIVG